MDQEFGLLNDNEVLHIIRGRILMSNPTFRVSEFLDTLAQLISEQEEEWTDESEGWFNDGLPCEALRLGNQGWQRGKVRIRLEFCPDPPPKLLKESPRTREEMRPRGEEIRLREDNRRRPNREDIYAREDIYSRGGNDFYAEDRKGDY